MTLPTSAQTSRRSLGLALTALAGFALTLAIYYPGVMNFDSKYIYDDVLTGFRGDWQSPVHTELWRLVDFIAPGSGSMLITTAALYWAAFGVLAVKLARWSLLAGVLLLVCAMLPPAFLLVGMIWRDVLFAALWLLSAAIVFPGTPGKALPWVKVLALVLISLGVLLRLNAIFAAPVLAIYVLWPATFNWKRTALLLLPLAALFYGLTQVVYYGLLDAKRQNALHAILVLDLGGISRVTGENQFPGTWSAEDTAKIVGTCDATEWINYWTTGPCTFVMAQLEVRDKMFGTPVITRAWIKSVTTHPIAYLQHRAMFFWNFIARQGLTMWLVDVDDQSKLPLADKPTFLFVKAVNDALQGTPLLLVGPWLLACFAVFVLAWGRRMTPVGSFVLGVTGSGLVYTLTYLMVGVAPDFRFAYWTVIAAIAGAAALIAARRKPA